MTRICLLLVLGVEETTAILGKLEETDSYRKLDFGQALPLVETPEPKKRVRIKPQEFQASSMTKMAGEKRKQSGPNKKVSFDLESVPAKKRSKLLDSKEIAAAAKEKRKAAKEEKKKKAEKEAAAKKGKLKPSSVKLEKEAIKHE